MTFDFISLGFMQRALLAGIIMSIVCGTLSIFILLRRLAFIGVGISHAAFGGIALGFLIGMNPMVSGIIFSIIVAFLIGWTRSRGKIEQDTTIGIFYSAAMAMGVVLLSFSKYYNVDIFGFLFGNILTIGNEDLWAIGIAGFIVLLFISLIFKELIYMSFDEEMATVSGIPVKILDYAFLSLLAVTIIISIKIVGIVLISSLLVVPAAAASQVKEHVLSLLILSILFSLLATISGLLVSYFLDLPSGATIVITLTLIFLICSIISRLK